MANSGYVNVSFKVLMVMSSCPPAHFLSKLGSAWFCWWVKHLISIL